MSTSIALSKNLHHLRIASNAQGAIDQKSLQAHVALVAYKYSLNSAVYEHNTGEKQPFYELAPTQEKPTNGQGEVPLTDQQNLLWTGIITFGGQDITIDFDTGSADTLVNKGAYKPGDTAKDTSTTFRDSYGDGTTAQGKVYTDVLQIGGLNPVSDVAIGLADSVFISGEGGSQGISGMAYPALGRFGQDHPPFFDALINAKAIDQPLFSFALSSDAGQSELVLGAISSKAAGEPTYVAVDTSTGFWQCAPGSSSVNGIPITAIIDSGTTLVVGTPSEVIRLFQSLEGVEIENRRGVITGWLASSSSVPKVTFTFGNKQITLADDVLIFGVDDTGRKMLSIQGQNVGIRGWIVGDPLFRSSVIVFNRRDNTIGFANRAT